MSGVAKPGRARGRGGPTGGQGRNTTVPAPGGSAMANVGDGRQSQQSSRTLSESSSASSELSAHCSKLTISSDDAVVREALLAPKKAPNNGNFPTYTIDTNMSKMNLPKHMPIFRYDIDIRALKPPTSNSKTYEIHLSKGSKDDFEATNRKDNCLTIFHCLCEIESEIFGDPSKYIYDRTSNLFSPDKLKIGDLKTFTIRKEALPEDMTVECSGVMIKIQPSTETFELTLDDFRSSITPDLNIQDRSLRSYLELVTSQDAVNRGEHVFFGGNIFHWNSKKWGLQDMELGEGKIMVSGANKGVKIIEGSGAGPEAVIVVDTKKAAFYVDQNTTETLKQIMNWKEQDLKNPHFSIDDRQYVSRYFKNIRVQKRFGKKNTFLIYGLSDLSANGLKLDVDDPDHPGKTKQIQLVDYYKKTYKITLEYPNLPCLMERVVGRKFNYYPMELCLICESQRVPMDKQTPEQMQIMIKDSAVKPFIRKEEIGSNMKALNLHQGGQKNNVLKALDITIDSKPIQVTAKQLPAPTPVYDRNSASVVNQERANWRTGQKYLDAATIRKWLVVVGCQSARMTPEKKTIDEFVAKMLTACRQKGMTMDPQMEIVYVEANKERMDGVMQKAKERGVQFVLYIECVQNTIHNHLKLMEALYQVVTQQVNIKVVRDVVQGKWQTLENIVHKTNEKTGGLNYRIVPDKFAKCEWLSNNEMMIVGYDVSHPPPQSNDDRRRLIQPRQPSTIGMSFNGAKNPEQFIGDFHYQQPRKEKVTGQVLTSRFVWMLQTFKKSRGALPRRVLVYRDGISEGQYKMFLTEEVPAIRAAFVEAGGAKYNPTLTGLIATKRHNRRFFKGTENPPPGTMIDQLITRADCSEFYLQSHRAIQGTAKATDYTVPVDDANMSMAEIEAITHALCYHHQIVNSAISLPEPVYQADEWAKRGKNVFNAYVEYYGYEVDDETAEMDFEKLSAKLCYMDKTLSVNRLV